MDAKILVNHLGFLPKAGKHFVVVGAPDAADFELMRLRDRHVVFRGTVESGVDLGPASVGRFSSFQDPGLYEIRMGRLKSRFITISESVYEPALHTLFNYFPRQRCGDSLTGWHSPCHTRDARRIDNGEHLDVSGGWHQSCDLRKWVMGTPFGVLGLSALKRLAAPRWDQGRIQEEVKWGNQYFHKMILEDGRLMDHVVLPEGW